MPWGCNHYALERVAWKILNTLDKDMSLWHNSSMATLKEKMNSQTASHAPSMHPAPYTPPPTYKKPEVLPSIREYIEDRKQLNQLKAMVEQHSTLGIQIRDLTKAKDSLTAAIKYMFGELEIEKAMVDEYCVTYYDIARSSIKGELLLDHGIAPAVIQACTVTTHSPALRITALEEYQTAAIAAARGQA